MQVIFEYLAGNEALLIFFLLGVGMAFGHIRVRGMALGAAAVLFFAIAMGAWALTYNIELVISKDVGHMGLALFAFAIGINSGPNFFAVLKTSMKPLLLMIIALTAAAGAALALGKALGMTGAQIGGTFAGAITNTPALDAAGSAAGDLGNATVGYSISYLFGVIGMIIVATLALSYGKNDRDKPAALINRTIRVERDDHPHIGDIIAKHGEQISFSRLRRGEDGPIMKPNGSDALERGDLITIVGPSDQVLQVVTELGHHSSHSLLRDRNYLDFRRITLSDPKHAGKTIAELNLGDRFGATISRVRRGDVDMVGTPDLVLQLGDRARVVAPISRIHEISKYLGDSSRGLGDINPIALGLGMCLGILLGAIPLPNPMGGTFNIGAAAGTLIIGLFMGKIGRIGNVVTALPYTACMVLSEFGLLVFLAQAGLNAGLKISTAFEGGDWWKMLVVGAVVTMIAGLGLYAMMRWIVKMGGTRLAGMLGGMQTQPAVLAYCNDRTGMDPRVALGYAMAYPVAMVVKIFLAKMLGYM